jgi:D-amino-acid dehydrogenase
MNDNIAIIGAGVVGLACATVLQMRGHRVTLVDPDPPGEGCSRGNAGCLSRASCVPLGLPGLWKKVPGYLLDPSGPLAIRPAYVPSLAPWLSRFQRASSPSRVAAIADALHALLDPSIAQWRPLAQRAGVPELIVQQGYALAYGSEAAFADDARGREIRRQHGVALEVLTGAAVREFEPSLSPSCTHLVVLPEQGHCPNPLRLSRALADMLREGGARLVARRALAFDAVGGRVARIVTDGDPVEADAVVICAGARSKPLARLLGSDVPL